MLEIGFPQLNEIIALLTSLNDKVAALATPAAAPSPSTAAAVDPPAKSAKQTRRAAAKPAPTEANDEDTSDTADIDDDEKDDLIARATFEARRVTRLFGIGGTRALIRKVAGAGALTVEDVPVSKLAMLIEELQAQR